MERSITKLFSRYKHQKHPITFIDTPGLEIEEDFKKMKDYLQTTKELFGDGKNKIHSVLYIINSSEPRNFNDKEISLIDFIQRTMKTQIFFVCTRAENEMNALNSIEYIKINLEQHFKNTDLVKFIYSCQLLDEKDGIFKRFGIEKILKEIHKFYVKEIKNLKNFLEGRSGDGDKRLDKQIFLSSLKEPYNFKKYFNTFCDGFIQYYAKLIDGLEIGAQEEAATNNHNQRGPNLSGCEIEEKENMGEMPSIEDMKKKTKKMLVEHLNYELNGNLSNEEKENLKKKPIDEFGLYFKNRFLENLKSNDEMEEAIKKYFINLIESYQSAIDSLENLYEEKK